MATITKIILLHLFTNLKQILQRKFNSKPQKFKVALNSHLLCINSMTWFDLPNVKL